jgi:predicted N-acetyltransferase YhbS
MNGSTWDDYRINADGGSFELIPDNWYWPWYNELLVNNGFEIVSKYYSSVDGLKNENYAPSFNRVMAKDDKNLIIRHINLDDLETELLKASAFCNVAFQKNLFFTPITSPDFANKYRPVMSRIESWQMLIAEYNSEMAGMLFAYTMPTEPKSLVLKTLARLPSSQFNDLGQALVYIMIQEARKRGYTKIVRAMMRYENGYWDAKKLSLGHIQKDYNLYIKKL